MELKQSDFINAREAFITPIRQRLEPKVDILLSKLAGKTILANDPRVLRLIVEFKKKTRRFQEKAFDKNGREYFIESNDNFSENPEFIKELKKI